MVSAAEVTGFLSWLPISQILTILWFPWGFLPLVYSINVILFKWDGAASLLLHISMHFFNSRFRSCSRHFRRLLFLTPSTIRSLIRLSARHAQNPHVLARDLRAAMYASIDTSCPWFRPLKTYHLYVSLTSPTANSSNFSMIFDKVFRSVSLVNCFPL